MKKINIIFACLSLAMIGSLSAQAQMQQILEKQKLNANQRIVNGIQALAKANSISNPKAKPNAAASRLMATSSYSYSGMDSANIPEDSIRIYWHELMGKDFNYLDYIGYNPFTYYELTPAEEVTYNEIAADSYAFYSWDSISFDLKGQYFQTFNNSNRVLSTEFYQMDNGVKNIMQLTDNFYTNELLTAINSAYYTGSNWLFSRHVYHYDANGNLTVKLSEYLNLDSFTYDAQNNLTSKTSYYYSASNWQPNSKQEYTYNAGKKESETYYYWDGSNWKQNSKQVFVYDNNILKRYYSLFWNNGANQWDSSSRYEYGYNASNVADTYTSYYYDVTDWVENYRYLGTYNDKGLLVEMIEQNWNDVETDWDNMERVIYEYNAFDQAALVEEYSAWNAADSVWEKQDYDDRYNLYYEIFDDGIDIKNVHKIDFNIFPNPANENINIHTGTEQIYAIVIYDNAGRMVTQQRYAAGAQGELSVDVSNLATGAYHISVVGKNATGTKTFVKQ